MKNTFLSFIILALCLTGFTAYSQTEKEETLLGLPGDNLDLAAVLDLFQKSKTIEDFEKTLNEQKTGINNLDLNLDEKADFIKVVTKQKDTDFSFILQVDVAEKETQDVAVILVSKDKNDKVSMQIVGDPDLYGKNYVVEPKPPVTANPGYVGSDPVATTTSTGSNTTTVVVVESAPVVQYVYSPVYVPYTPPYYYNYYPPYYAAFTVMAVSAYRYNCYHAPYHGGYHGGGYGNTVIINNNNNYNNYNNHRNTSNTVNNNRNNGNYNKNNVSNRASTGNNASNRASAGTSASNRASAGTSASTRQSTGASTSQSSSTSTRQSTGTSARQSSSTSTRQSTGSTRQSGSYSGGGRSGGSYSGGGARSGGGGGRGGGGRR